MNGKHPQLAEGKRRLLARLQDVEVFFPADAYCSKITLYDGLMEVFVVRGNDDRSD
jgi:hypothetical protein